MTKLKKLNLVLGQLQAITLDGLDTLAKVTDSVEEGSDIDATVNLEAGYADTIEKLQAAFPSLRINVGKNYIRFETEMTKAWILTKLGDGTGVTADEAAAYIFPSKTFYRTNPVDKFNELRYFTAWGATINGNPSAWQYAFENAYALEELTLPDTLYDIPTYFFNNCTALKHVGGLEHVSKVRALSFVGTKLEGELNLPLLDTLQDGAFYGTKITKVVNLGSIPSVADSNTNTSRGIFANCSELTDVILPNTVTFIGNIAFYNSSKLSEINFADVAAQITKIGERAFYNTKVHFELDCPNLETLGYASFWSTKITSIKNLGTVSSLAAASNDSFGMFQNCTELLDVRLPYSLLTIGTRAFKGCSKLQTVTGGARVTSIGDHAFYNCSSISTCTVDFTQVTTIGDSAFRGAFAADCGLEISMPNITSIGFGAFKDAKIKSITDMGSAIKTLASTDNSSRNTFGTNTLESIVLPTQLEVIQTQAFYNATKLTNVVMPETITTLAAHAFNGCPLTGMEFRLPNCTSIGIAAFKNTGSFKILSLGQGCVLNSTDNSGNGTFNGSKITEINLKGVVSIQMCAFMNCSQLATVGSLEDVTSLSNYVFYQTPLLTDVIRMPSLTAPGSSVFCNSGIKGVADLGSITSIPSPVYQSRGYFASCPNLKFVILPDTITSIGGYAFYQSSKLRAVILKTIAPPTAYFTSFNALGANAEFFVPVASLDEYKAAAYWSTIATRIFGYTAVEELPESGVEGMYYLKGENLYRFNESKWQVLDMEMSEWRLDVQFYDWMQLSGSAKIDTGRAVAPKEILTFDADVKLTASGNWYPYEAMGPSWSSRIYPNINTTSSTLYMGTSTALRVTHNVGLNRLVTHRVEQTTSGVTLSILDADGSVIASDSQSAVVTTTTPNLSLVGGSLGMFSRFRIKKEGILIQDLRPAMLNGVAGMYDSIADQFFGNSSDSGEILLSND